MDTENNDQLVPTHNKATFNSDTQHVDVVQEDQLTSRETSDPRQSQETRPLIQYIQNH